MDPPFETRVVRETGTTRIIVNPDGLTAEVPTIGNGTIPHFISATIVTPDDWKKCKAERFRIDDEARYPDPAGILASHPNDRDYPLGVFC